MAGEGVSLLQTTRSRNKVNFKNFKKNSQRWKCLSVCMCLWLPWVGNGGGGGSLKKFNILCFVSKVISWSFTSTSAQITRQYIYVSNYRTSWKSLQISGIWILRFSNVLWLTHESILIHILTKTINTEIYIYFISTCDGHQFVYFIKGFSLFICMATSFCSRPVIRFSYSPKKKSR